MGIRDERALGLGFLSSAFASQTLTNGPKPKISRASTLNVGRACAFHGLYFTNDEIHSELESFLTWSNLISMYTFIMTFIAFNF